MTIQVALTHRTAYRYDRAITLGPQSIRLRKKIMNASFRKRDDRRREEPAA